MFGAFALFVFFLVVFIPGVSPTVFGGDSGDIIVSYFFGNIAHPPGYPLNTILGWLISHSLSFFGGSFALRANMVSAFYQAASCVMVYLLLRKLTKNSLVGAFAAFTLAFSTLFWLYAHIAEVFQLTTLLILISLYFILGNFESKKVSRKKYLTGLFVWGLAVFHHLTAILLLPAYIYVFWNKRETIFVKKSDFVKAAAAFIAGVIPYSYAVAQSLTGNLHNWETTLTPSDLWRLISRGDYGTFSATNDLVGIDFKARILQIVWYLKFVLADFNILGLLLALCGLVFLYFKNRKLFWILFLSWFFCGPFFFFYASFPLTDSFFKGVAERFLLNSYVFVAILAGFGLLAFVDVLKILSKGRFVLHSLTVKILCLGFFLLPVSLGLLRADLANLNDYKLGGILAKDILTAADPPGIVLVQGDTSSFNSEYGYFVEKYNPHARLISAGKLGRPTYRQELLKLYPDLSYPEMFYSKKRITSTFVVSPFIEANIGKVPIYVFEPISSLKNQYTFVRIGMLNRLFLKGKEPDGDELAKQIKQKISEISFKNEYAGGYLHFFPESIVGDYVQIFSENGEELLSRKMYEESRQYFLRALSLDKENKNAAFKLGISYVEDGKCTEAVSIFKEIINRDATYWQAYEGLARVEEKCNLDNSKKLELLKKSQEIRKRQNTTPIG